jgi:hypothetical protein
MLDSMERRRRTGLILSRIPPAESLFRDLARAAAQFPAEIRNAIANAIPATFKGLVYGRAEHTRSTLVLNDEDSVQEVVAPLTPVSEPNQGLVLLLGNWKDHERNSRRLKNNGFVIQRAKSIEEFHRILSDEVCGVVVAKSWWNVLSPGQHGEVLDELLAYSSFVWLKINTDGLSVQDVFERFTETRFRKPRATELQVSDSHDITDAELSLLYASAEVSRDAVRAHLYSGEVPARDARVIVGSTKAYVQDRNSTDRGALRDISARILQGGRSGAMLVHISTDGRSLPFVAKVGEVGTLRKELQRFHTFVAPFDRQLKPELYFHKNRAAIVFGLVASPDDDCDAAPTLHEILHDSLLSESGGSAKCASETELNTLISRVIGQLKRLNAQRPQSKQIASGMWTGLDELSKMDDAGISWKLLPLSDGACPLQACRDVDEYAEELNDVSVVHGDIHLRNILVRDYREPHLIDYAYAGPGHPCYDLVRLESALLFCAFRMTDREEIMRELLTAVGRGNDFGSVQAEFPTLVNGIGNRVAIGASIAARQACLELLAEHDRDEGQYHAMKVIVSCQSLAKPECQTGVVRASVSAAAECFLHCRQSAVS